MEQVEVMFGLPGGAILPVYDPIIESTIRHILVRHEQGAGHMAEGYAHATGRPGVAMVTSGSGGHQHRHEPLCDAYMDSIPMVCVTGQVARSAIGTDAFQECDTTRDHHVGDQAQLARHRRAGHPPGDRRGIPCRHDRAVLGPSWSTCPRTWRTATMDWLLARRRGPARLQADDARPPPDDQGGGPADRLLPGGP